MNRRLIILIALLPSLAFSESWENFHDWPRVGKTTFKVLFFKIYDIELRTPDGNYGEESGLYKPLGIKIRYRRNIDKKDLIKRTVEQWQYLGVKEEQQMNWAPQLSAAWPDIRKGDEILYLSNGQSGAFYYRPQNGTPTKTGSITEQAFNAGFLSIWLSPDTYYYDVRSQLLNL
jgi:hypothetical protein